MNRLHSFFALSALLHWNGSNCFTAPTFSMRTQMQPSSFGIRMDLSSLEDHIFTDDLTEHLDLIPLMQAVADCTGTKRGRQALLSLVNQDIQMQDSYDGIASRIRRVSDQYKQGTGTRSFQQRTQQRNQQIVKLAQSSDEARREYELVEQAMVALNRYEGLTHPPLYGGNLSPSEIKGAADSDDDEWLWVSGDQVSLESVLQAEQVLKTLRKVYEWAKHPSVKKWTPGLADIAGGIVMDTLSQCLEDIDGAVEIVQIKSLSDPKGRSTFTFQLKHSKFPELGALKKKEAALVESIDTEMKKVIRKLKGSPEYVDYKGRKLLLVPRSVAAKQGAVIRGSEQGGRRCYMEPRDLVVLGDKLVDVRTELEQTEIQLERQLIHAIQTVSSPFDASLQAMARLDTIFARAAFAKKVGAVIPKIVAEGVIDIDKFVHPILALGNPKDAVPIDLHLFDDSKNRALIISGPNGGGKTLAMKSFGLVSAASKVGIPVPVKSFSEPGPTPRIGFFDNIYVEMGDQQSVMEGESTFLAKLNAYSSLIAKISPEEISQEVEEGDDTVTTGSSLILMDELGSGTDPSAGGAIAQAILEKLLASGDCRLVATTHSPRLKALSYNNDDFQCATVLLKATEESEFKLPTYQLQYGIIGDSYALGAVSRSKPSLPTDVVERAAALIGSPDNGGDEVNGELIKALTDSLETQVREVDKARRQAQTTSAEMQQCREAMLTLAVSYETHLNQIEVRLAEIYEALNEGDNMDVDLVGDSLGRLRIVKRKTKSDAEVLREKGLRAVPRSHAFFDGETVIIIAKGPWQGSTGTVVVDDIEQINSNDVVVIPGSYSSWDDSYFDPTGEVDPMVKSEPMAFRRDELAIWDFDSIWDGSKMEETRTVTIKEAQQRLGGLLSTLSTTPAEKAKERPTVAGVKTNPITSSRQRQAAKKKKSEKKKGKKGKRTVGTISSKQ